MIISISNLAVLSYRYKLYNLFSTFEDLYYLWLEVQVSKAVEQKLRRFACRQRLMTRRFKNRLRVSRSVQLTAPAAEQIIPESSKNSKMQSCRVGNPKGQSGLVKSWVFLFHPQTSILPLLLSLIISSTFILRIFFLLRSPRLAVLTTTRRRMATSETVKEHLSKVEYMELFGFRPDPSDLGASMYSTGARLEGQVPEHITVSANRFSNLCHLLLELLPS